MNPDLKDLRVLVVPTETDNGIDQDSTVEEILSCDETKIFTVTDYFQAQNDADLDLLHWSFLINIETKQHLNGCNIDGIDYHQKAINIDRIKTIIKEYGSFNVGEIEGESSPIYNSMGKHNFALVERFNLDDVEVVQYVHDQETDSFNLKYEDLSEDLIGEIRMIVENYEADMLRTEKRCKS